MLGSSYSLSRPIPPLRFLILGSNEICSSGAQAVLDLCDVVSKKFRSDNGALGLKGDGCRVALLKVKE